MQNRITEIPQIHFTDSAFSVLYDVVDDPYFLDRDAEIIYEALRRRLRAVPFCDYLKRFLYKAAEMTAPFREVPLEDFRRILSESFRETLTPVSFDSVTAKPATLFKNWLTQKSVRRDVVLLLGFGLRMREEEVNEMLVKALHERALSPADPRELICWYCYRKGYPFPRFTAFWELYGTLEKEKDLPSSLAGEDAELMKYLLQVKQGGDPSRRAAKLRETFDNLFARSQTVAAALMNAEGKGEKTPASVTEADLEKILCAAIPRDSHGNLSPAKKSLLCALFAGKSPSRQRMGRVRAGKEAPDRFDLITLSFFLASQKRGERKKRYMDFLEETNGLLDACGFGPLYVANPYECFILMCILSEDPLATYSDVWELSYNDEEKS